MASVAALDPGGPCVKAERNISSPPAPLLLVGLEEDAGDFGLACVFKGVLQGAHAAAAF